MKKRKRGTTEPDSLIPNLLRAFANAIEETPFHSTERTQHPDKKRCSGIHRAVRGLLFAPGHLTVQNFVSFPLPTTAAASSSLEMRTGTLVALVACAALACAAAAFARGGDDGLKLESPGDVLHELHQHDRRMHGHESPQRFLERLPGKRPAFYDESRARDDGNGADEDPEIDDPKPTDGDDPNDGTADSDHSKAPSRGLRDAYKTYRFRGTEENMRASYYRFQELSEKAERSGLSAKEAEELVALRRLRRGWGKKLKKGLKKVGSFVGKVVKGGAALALGAITGIGKTADKVANGGKKKLDDMLAQDIEDCVGCRFVWLGVELEVGNSQMEETIYDSFVKRCMEAEKAPIFFQTCQDMFDDVYGMIGDYMNGFTVNQVCEGAKMCR